MRGGAGLAEEEGEKIQFLFISMMLVAGLIVAIEIRAVPNIYASTEFVCCRLTKLMLESRHPWKKIHLNSTPLAPTHTGTSLVEINSAVPHPVCVCVCVCVCVLCMSGLSLNGTIPL